MKKIIEYRKNGLLIQGEFIERTVNRIVVRMLYPFIGWVGGVEDHNKKFMTQKGVKAAKKLLLDGYKKVKLVDKHIHNFAIFYEDDVIEERDELLKLPPSEDKEYASGAVRQWFFNNFMLRPEYTGLTLTGFREETDFFEAVINEYSKTGQKIYLARNN